MTYAHTITALIPARGGSKGIPRKNIRDVAGKPLVAWSIEAAQASKVLSHIYVSTEDEEIAQIAGTYGARTLKRPDNLASDAAQNHDVLLDALDQMDEKPDILLLLQPTSPLRTAEDIDLCVQALLDQPDAQCAASVCETEYHPAKALKIKDNKMDPYTNWSDTEARRQTLEPVYRQNGAVYAIKTDVFLREKRFLVPPVATYIMPTARSVDVDNEIDLLLVDAIMRQNKETS